MSRFCGECTYLDLSTGDIYGKFYCERRYERHTANDVECSSYCTAYSRSDSEIRNAMEYSKDHTSSGGCYITTIICDILKAPEKNTFIETLRWFRNNVLQNDEKYKDILVEYDIVGPVIAKNISNDPLKYQIAANAFFKYIKPITRLIKSKNYDEAINSYKDMTNRLKNFYNINTTVTVEEINNADIKSSGHGIYKVKRITDV